MSTASAHCIRPNQHDRRGMIHGHNWLYSVKVWCNSVLYSLTGSASSGSLLNICVFFRGIWSLTITRFDRGYASETCPGLVSTLLFPNLRPSSNSPSICPPIGRLPPSKTSVAVAFYRLCSRLRKLQVFAPLAITH